MKVVKVSLLAVCLLFITVAASATTATGTLSVSANVIGGCYVNGETQASLQFGYYVPSSGQVVQSQATIQAYCTNGVEARILLDEGLNPAPGSTLANPVRQMNNAMGSYLAYQLYSDNFYTTVWDGVNGVPYMGLGDPQFLTVYGAIPANQGVPQGTYQDTVTITIVY